MRIPKAAVFPVPVRDWTIRSLPDMERGMVRDCTSVGSWYPIFSRAARTSGLRANFVKL
jgi:hypothetical protein